MKQNFIADKMRVIVFSLKKTGLNSFYGRNIVGVVRTLALLFQSPVFLIKSIDKSVVQ